MFPWASAWTLRSVRVNSTLFTFQPFLFNRSLVKTAGMSYSEIVDGWPSLISRLPFGFSTSTSAARSPVTMKNTVGIAKNIPFILVPPLALIGLVLGFFYSTGGASPAISVLLLDGYFRRAFVPLHPIPPLESCSNCRNGTDYRLSRRGSAPPSERDFPPKSFLCSN